MATLGAARAAGLDRLVGSLEPGKRADLVVRQRDAVELGPGIDPAHQLVTLGHGPTADTVLVNGRVVLEGGRSTLVEPAEVIQAARASVGRIAARLGLALRAAGRAARGGVGEAPASVSTTSRSQTSPATTRVIVSRRAGGRGRAWPRSAPRRAPPARR